MTARERRQFVGIPTNPTKQKPRSVGGGHENRPAQVGGALSEVAKGKN